MLDFGFLRFSLLLFRAHFTICRTPAGLLSTAQFVKKNAFTPVYCCYTKHNSKNLFRELLFAAHFTKICIFPSPLLRSAQFFRMQGAVVIGSTIPVCRIFASGVVKRSTFCRAAFPYQYCNGEHNSKKFSFMVVIPDTFQKSHPKLRPQNFCAKIFLRCYRRHIVAQHTALLLDSAQQGWNPPHSFVVIFDIAIPYF